MPVLLRETSPFVEPYQQPRFVPGAESVLPRNCPSFAKTLRRVNSAPAAWRSGKADCALRRVGALHSVAADRFCGPECGNPSTGSGQARALRQRGAHRRSDRRDFAPASCPHVCRDFDHAYGPEVRGQIGIGQVGVRHEARFARALRRPRQQPFLPHLLPHHVSPVPRARELPRWGTTCPSRGQRGHGMNSARAS